MVSWLSVFFIILDMILGLAIPVGVMMHFKKKFQLSIMPFWVGCATMMLFALVLEQVVHYVFLTSSVGKIVQENNILIALYGGLMAGLFEECGRFIAMKFVLRNKHDNAHNALMYGAGHGGIEMFMILVFGMMNNLIYAIMLNLDKADALMKPLDITAQNTLQASFNTLISTPPLLFLVSPLERILAISGQLGLSVIVWFAVVKKKGQLLILAILLHTVLDAIPAFLAKVDLPVVLIEVIVFVIIVFIILCARKIWKKEDVVEL